MSADLSSIAPLCANASLARQEAPIGTASTHEQQIFVELELPWAPIVTESRHYSRELRKAWEPAWRTGRTIRVVAIATDQPHTLRGLSHVISVRRPAGACSRFLKDEFAVPPKLVARLVAALLEQPPALRDFERYRQQTEHLRDLFICTHGAHDACCGAHGMPLYEYARHAYGPDAGSGVRVWRTSHLGGHRFAPTLIDFPQGRSWARMTPDALDAIVSGSGALDALLGHYRGWGALGTPYEQVLEREAFRRHGWVWTGYSVSGELLEFDELAREALVRITYESPDRRDAGCYEANVSVERRMALPACLASGSEGTAAQYQMTGLVQRQAVLG